MYNIELLPIKLSAMGVPRAVASPKPDLITVYKTPYPVLTYFKKFCAVAGIPAFAGGTWQEQGPPGIGYINSGYRVKIGAKNSDHKFALGIDPIIGDLDEQIRMAVIANNYFTRIGIYPDMGILHLSLAPLCWIKHYKAKRFWVKIGKVYTSFDHLDKAIAFALKKKT